MNHSRPEFDQHARDVLDVGEYAAARAMAPHPPTAGEFDVLVEVVHRDDDELLDVLDSIRAVAGVQRCQTFLYLSFDKYAYDESSMSGLGGAQRLSPGTKQEPPALDEADLAIIRGLREDGRASYTDLASISGMTYPSARRGVLRSREAGVLHINTIVN